MALKKYYIGDQGPYFVDTAKALHDPDGDFPAITYQAGFITNAPIYGVTFYGYVVSTLEVSNIDDPSTELNAENADSIGAMVYCYETTVGVPDEFTLYLWDTSYGSENPPYVVDGSSGGGWVAVGGKYQATDKTFGGTVKFAGSGRHEWTKITANSITLSVGSSSEDVTDIRTAHDGNIYDLIEAAATPAMNLIIDFESVSAFNWVNIIGIYNGTGTHSVAIQLYNWTQTRWDTFGSFQTSQEDVSTSDGYILGNHDFIVPDDTEYIGTGGDIGNVRVRFYHTMAGNASHNLYIDVVALYQ